MPKPRLAIGGIAISLLSVVSLHLTTQRQPVTNQLQTSFRSVVPALALALPGEDTADLAIAAGQFSSESDYAAVANPAAVEVTLDPQAIAVAQPAPLAKSAELREVVSNYFLVRDSPFWMTQVRQSRLDVEGVRPILKHSLATIGFRADDQAFIQRYANRQHLPLADVQWQYFDPTIVASLAEQRRVATDAIAPDDAGNEAQRTPPAGEDLPRWQQEVAPGGGKYWTEDPNAAWW